MKLIARTICVLAAALTTQSAVAKSVRYELTATRGSVDLSGKGAVDFALMLNGSIPAPTLTFDEGDDAEILVTNKIPGEELSIHWHGILLPPLMDGVPYVTTPPIHSGDSFTFKFKVRQHGTYWYHSHTNVQEQKGLFGPIVIRPKQPTLKYDRDVVAVISDWSDEDGLKILNNLKKDGDYYLYKKNTIRSWWGAIRAGKLGTFLHNEFTRMGGMDYSDVGYDAFLINGKRDSQLATMHPGETVRLRIINAAGSSYFHINLAGQPMRVISADGIDTEPVLAQEILIGMAETYDVLVTLPEHKNYELRVTAQDGTGSASGWLGMGDRVSAPVKPAPDMYAAMDHGSMNHDAMDHSKMDHGAASQGSGHGEHDAATHEGAAKPDPHAGHAGHNHSSHASPAPAAADNTRRVGTLTVDDLQANAPTAFPGTDKAASSNPPHDIRFVLDGDMERYIWYINGKAIHQDRTVFVKQGEVVRFTFENRSMMHHPMHFHGHFFRVLNQFGARSPLKHTVDVGPHMTRTVEFLADEPGEWMLHCHNLFHMKTGMARVIKYEGFRPSPEIEKLQGEDPHNHDHWYFYGMTEVATNHGQGAMRLSQTWNEIDARIEVRNGTTKFNAPREDWEAEGDLLYRRWFSPYLSVLAGGVHFDGTGAGAVGFSYKLPMLIESQWMVTHLGRFRLDIGKKFQWTSHFLSDVDVSWRPAQGHEKGKDFEYEATLLYAPNWTWSGGLMVTDGRPGAGIRAQF